MARPAIRITLIDRLGKCGCHRGHRVGDSWDFDTQRGQLCPMAMHVSFPYVDILRYGGSIPGQPEGTAVFCCPDVDTINVFRIQGEKPEERPGAARLTGGEVSSGTSPRPVPSDRSAEPG